MKKLFTLLFVFVALTAVAKVENFPKDGEFKTLGTGRMTDDMLTDLLGYVPVTFDVTIEESAEVAGCYRIRGAYGKSFAEAMLTYNNIDLKDSEIDLDGKGIIYIDATDPDHVYIPKSYIGLSWTGNGEMYIGIPSSADDPVLRNGIITSTMRGMALGDDKGAVALNRRGKFRVVMPGYEAADIDIVLTPESQCLGSDRIFKVNVNVGADVVKARYAVLFNVQEDEMTDYVDQVASRGTELKERGDMTFEMGDPKKETLVVVGLDANGDYLSHAWTTYYYTHDVPADWTDCGTAELTDGLLGTLSNIPVSTMSCTLQRNVNRPDWLRLVNPYKTHITFAKYGHAEHDHYIYINAEDPECIYIEESPLCLDYGKGMTRITSMVDYFLQAGFDLDECKELEMGAILEDGVMTFPEEALCISMLKYDDGDWWTADEDGATQIRMPENFMLASSVTDIAVDNDATAPAQYFNLQGVRIAAPVPGVPAIERRGNKARVIRL